MFVYVILGFLFGMIYIVVVDLGVGIVCGFFYMECVD